MPDWHRSPTTLTVSSRLSRKLIQYTVSLGACKDALIAASGIDPAVLEDADARVPCQNHGRLWRAAVAVGGDPDFGLRMGCSVPANDFALVGYVVTTASTLKGALDALTRYFSVMSEGIVLELDPGREGGRAHVTVRLTETDLLPTVHRHRVETTLAMVESMSRAVTGRGFPGCQIAFTHDRPSTGTDYHEEVFGVMPTFGAPDSRLSFDAAALGWPTQEASPQLHATLRAEAEAILASLRPSMAAGVKQAVAERLRDGVPTLPEVAARLAMGERTLQRHLEEEDTTFLAVVESARRELATRHLDNGLLTLQEIASLVGYSNPSAFHRAFKRWTGMTPRAYRIHRDRA